MMSLPLFALLLLGIMLGLGLCGTLGSRLPLSLLGNGSGLLLEGCLLGKELALLLLYKAQFCVNVHRWRNGLWDDSGRSRLGRWKTSLLLGSLELFWRHLFYHGLSLSLVHDGSRCWRRNWLFNYLRLLYCLLWGLYRLDN